MWQSFLTKTKKSNQRDDCSCKKTESPQKAPTTIKSLNCCHNNEILNDLRIIIRGTMGWWLKWQSMNQVARQRLLWSFILRLFWFYSYLWSANSEKGCADQTSEREFVEHSNCVIGSRQNQIRSFTRLRE